MIPRAPKASNPSAPSTGISTTAPGTNTGREGFVLIKSVLIGTAILVLCLHKNFVLARIGIVVAAASYTALNVYHLSLF